MNAEQVRAQPRRAALMAHALTAADQAWLLRSLAPERRRLLEGLLAELRELGIPPDGSLLDAVKLECAATTASVEPAETTERQLDRLPAAGVRDLAELLRHEPPGVAARLLAMRPWPWRSALLGYLGDDFARQVREASVEAGAPRLEAALGTALLGQLSGHLGQSGRLGAARIWNRARSMLVRPRSRR